MLALANLFVSCCSGTDLPACSLPRSGQGCICLFHTRDMAWIQRKNCEAAHGVLLEKVCQLTVSPSLVLWADFCKSTQWNLHLSCPCAPRAVPNTGHKVWHFCCPPLQIQTHTEEVISVCSASYIKRQRDILHLDYLMHIALKNAFMHCIHILFCIWQMPCRTQLYLVLFYMMSNFIFTHL